MKILDWQEIPNIHRDASPRVETCLHTPAHPENLETPLEMHPPCPHLKEIEEMQKGTFLKKGKCFPPNNVIPTFIFTVFDPKTNK